MNKYKKDFPIFANNKSLIYLDNAATTQKEESVISKELEVYTNYNANVHRGFYPIAETVTKEYENAREKIASFINSKPKEIIFTAGTTNSINLLAQTFVKNGILKANDTVLLTELEHNSNLLPWKLTEAKIEFIHLNSNFGLDYESAKNISPKVVAISLVSNVTGEILQLNKLRKLYPNAIFVIDACQAPAHIKIDVKDLDCDFLVLSAHKMYGPTGVGIMFGKEEYLSILTPANLGGGTVLEVSEDDLKLRDIPERFEAGTPAVAQAIAMACATEYILKIGFEAIRSHEQKLLNYTLQSLQKFEGINFYRDNSRESIGIVSFNIEGIHPHDIAYSMGERNICLRAGNHCTQILHSNVFKANSSVRLSLGIYNSNKEIDLAIKALNEVVTQFKK